MKSLPQIKADNQTAARKAKLAPFTRSDLELLKASFLNSYVQMGALGIPLKEGDRASFKKLLGKLDAHIEAATQ